MNGCDAGLIYFRFQSTKRIAIPSILVDVKGEKVRIWDEWDSTEDEPIKIIHKDGTQVIIHPDGTEEILTEDHPQYDHWHDR